MTHPSSTHGYEFYDDSWQLIPPYYGATDYEWVLKLIGVST